MEPLEVPLRAPSQQSLLKTANLPRKSQGNPRKSIKVPLSARLKIMIHKVWPRLFAVYGRQEAADEEDGVGDGGVVHTAKVEVALIAERVRIEVDHVAVDEVIGRQALENAVDMAVADAAGKIQKDVEIVERADAFENLFFDSAGEVRGDYVCGSARCVDVGGEIPTDRVEAVFFEQDPVEFALDLFVGDLAARGEVVDVAVAGAVKGKVAQEAAQIGVVRSMGAPCDECPAGLREEFFSGQAVHAASFRVERVVGEGLVVEEKVRAVNADVEQIFFLKKIFSGFLGQGSQNVLAEAVVCIC